MLSLLPPPRGEGAVRQPPETSADEFFIRRWPCLRRQPYGPAFSSGADTATRSEVQILRFREISYEQIFGTFLNAPLTRAEQIGI